MDAPTHTRTPEITREARTIAYILCGLPQIGSESPEVLRRVQRFLDAYSEREMRDRIRADGHLMTLDR